MGNIGKLDLIAYLSYTIAVVLWWYEVDFVMIGIFVITGGIWAVGGVVVEEIRKEFQRAKRDEQEGVE